MMQLNHKLHHLNIAVLFPEVTYGEWLLLVTIERQNQGDGLEPCPLEPDHFTDGKEACTRSPGTSHFAKMLECSPPMISKMLRSLETKEMIVRQTDTKDRRNTHVFLTEKGKELIQAGKERADQLFDEAIRTIGEDRMNQTMDTMEEFYQILKKELEDK